MTSNDESQRGRLSVWPRGQAVMGRCIVDRLVRRDPLAAVYLARSIDVPSELHLVWAVQSHAVVRSPEAARGFAEAMQRLTEIDHRALPKIEAVDVDGPAPVVVAHRPEGETLRERIDREGVLLPEVVGSMVSTVASALEELWVRGHGALHRGVSPEVVFFTGERVIVETAGWIDALVTAGYVSDRAAMGFAREGYAPPSELAFPPERGMDAFALAVVAFEALTGHLPFGRGASAEVDTALGDGQRPVPSAWRPELPVELDEVFLRAWGVLAGRNFGTAMELAREFESAVEGHGAGVRVGPEDRKSDGLEGVAVDQEPTPSYGEYGALLAMMDAAANPSHRPERRDDGDGVQSPTAQKRTLPGGALASVPRDTWQTEGVATLGTDRSAVELGDEDVLDSDSIVGRGEIDSESTRESFDELSEADLESIVPDEPEGVDSRSEGDGVDVLSALHALHARHAPMGELSQSGIVAPATVNTARAIARIPTQAGPLTPSLRELGVIALTRSHHPPPNEPSPEEAVVVLEPEAVVPVEASASEVEAHGAEAITTGTALAPTEFARSAELIQTASRGLAIVTAVTALLSVAVLVLASRAVDRLADELQRTDALGPYSSRSTAVPTPVTVIETPRAEVLEAGVQDQSQWSARDGATESASEDASAETDAQRAVADDVRSAIDEGASLARQSESLSREGQPGAGVYARVTAALRGPVADCVEGLEDPRGVRVSLGFSGQTGAVTSVRVRGLFAEPPMGPCIEEAARRVRIAPFRAERWEPTFRFQIAPPRWRPDGE